jgi:RHS repeat-associated protein
LLGKARAYPDPHTAVHTPPAPPSGETQIPTSDEDAAGNAKTTTTTPLGLISEDGGPSNVYAYDADDNRASFTGGSGTTTATYDAQDRLLTYGSATYTYTANGDLATKTDGTGTTTYTYDVFGNLLSAALPGGNTVSYLVDGENRRLARELNGMTTSEYLYKNALNVVAQLDGSGNLVTRYVFGSKPNVPDYLVDTNGNKFRVLSDHLGSPRLVVNAATGVVAEEIDYDEFGNVTNDTSPGLTPFGFAGGMYDTATGLVRFGARDYDAETGRWTSKDPIRFKGGMNLYGYVVNDPVNGLDPHGTSEAGELVCEALCEASLYTSGHRCAGTCGGSPACFAWCEAVNIAICLTVCAPEGPPNPPVCRPVSGCDPNVQSCPQSRCAYNPNTWCYE